MMFIAVFLIFWVTMWLAPSTFRYLVLAPCVGVPLGGFTWGICVGIFGVNVFSIAAFISFVLAGPVFVAVFMKVFDSEE